MSEYTKKWSDEETKHLISSLELLPSLWDVHSVHYRNRNTKRKALAELAAEFAVEDAEVQWKLHILRSQYQQEVKKVRAKKSGQGADESYMSNWRHFDSLSDIAIQITSRKFG